MHRINIFIIILLGNNMPTVSVRSSLNTVDYSTNIANENTPSKSESPSAEKKSAKGSKEKGTIYAILANNEDTAAVAVIGPADDQTKHVINSLETNCDLATSIFQE